MKKYKTKYDMSFALDEPNVYCNINHVKNKKIIKNRHNKSIPVIHFKKGKIVQVESYQYGFYMVKYDDNVCKIHPVDFIERNLICIPEERKYY